MLENGTRAMRAATVGEMIINKEDGAMKATLKILMWGVLLVTAMPGPAGAAPVQSFAFKDTDIRIVLAAIAQLASADVADINIVPSADVQGTVTVDLAQVDWETALNVLLKSYNLESSRQKNVILIRPIGPGGSTAGTEIRTRVFSLKFLDGNDAKKAIMPILSPAGKTAVLETTGQSGWGFGTEAGKKAIAEENKLKRTKILVVSDTADRIEQIAALLDQLDVMPKQIMIKTRILEVSHNLLKDLGVDWGTGKTGAETSPLQAVSGSGNTQFAIHSLAPTPSMFLSQTTSLTSNNGGMQFMFQHLTGAQFEVVLHALEENSKSNMLSAPILMTLNNQEATILIGTKYPIIQTEVSSTTNNIVGGSLQEYKDIGIQLNVVPQIWGEKENYINLIVHPAVSSYSTTAKVIDQSGTTLVQYPIISTREAQTQLIIPDNGTVMMGGLLQDVESAQVIGVPVLSKIPLLGALFRRNVKTTEKIELVIFITAHIMTPEEQVSPGIMDTVSVERNFTKP